MSNERLIRSLELLKNAAALYHPYTRSADIRRTIELCRPDLRAPANSRKSVQTLCRQIDEKCGELFRALDVTEFRAVASTPSRLPPIGLIDELHALIVKLLSALRS